MMQVSKAEDVFKEYAQLKIKEREIQKEIVNLSGLLMEYMTNQNIEKQPTTLGNFSIAKRRTWKFSPAVDRATKEVEDLKVKEKGDGTASFTEKPYLLFTVPNEKDYE